MAVSSLSNQQLFQLEVIERVTSCFSVLGTSFVVITFIASPAFRKPINRLIFYASWGNLMCNIATLIAQSGIRAGRNSHLCQFQSFLIHMFLPADALWNLAMATNVYLTVFRRFSATKLKKLEWIYILVCYGFTFIDALTCLLISTPSRGKIYGPNLLWCSIAKEWAFLRIAMVYGPAWVCLVLSLCIYTISGIELFKRRAQLGQFEAHKQFSTSAENLVTNFKTLQIQVVSEPVGSISGIGDSLDKNPIPGVKYPTAPSRSATEVSRSNVTTTINATPRGEIPDETINPVRSALRRKKQHRSNVDANRAAMAYTKVALLFFFCLVITWVPASVNRFYSFIHPDEINVPSSYVTSVVLPLMGFWNSVIYIVTSRRAVRAFLTGRSNKQMEWDCSVDASRSRSFAGSRNATTGAEAKRNSAHRGIDDLEGFGFEEIGGRTNRNPS